MEIGKVLRMLSCMNRREIHLDEPHALLKCYSFEK